MIYLCSLVMLYVYIICFYSCSQHIIITIGLHYTCHYVRNKTMRKPLLCHTRLKEIRELKGWSKNYASEEMGIAQSVYVRYESGESKPSYSAIRNMALTLGTSVEYLTDKTDDPSPREMIISCRDPKLTYIIEAYPSFDADDKERIYRYTQKLITNIKKRS